MPMDLDVDERVARVAAAIGEPARARMLFCLMGNRARTSTELALVAAVSPSTASVHLNRLLRDGFIRVSPQGRHRYYRLDGPDVAAMLEGLLVFADGRETTVHASTPVHLRAARTCYDHVAGTLGVQLHDGLLAAKWIALDPEGGAISVTPAGAVSLAHLGIDVEAERRRKRRFAYECMDWSERRPHIGGALGASLLALALEKKWLAQHRDSRALRITPLGDRAMSTYFRIDTGR